MNTPRWDGWRYRDCKWCGGRGCVYCEAELDKEYKRQFPDGPKPIATFKTDDPVDLARAVKAIGGDALAKAFGDGGGGVQEIINNCLQATKDQLKKP
jgi:hypothetical protein